MRLLYKEFYSYLLTSFLISKYQKKTLAHLLTLQNIKITLNYPTLRMSKPFFKYLFHYVAVIGQLPTKTWYVKKQRLEQSFLQFSLSPRSSWNFLMKFSFFGLANTITGGIKKGQGANFTNSFFSKKFIYPETKFFGLLSYYGFRTPVFYTLVLSKSYKNCYFSEQRNLFRLLNIPYIS